MIEEALHRTASSADSPSAVDFDGLTIEYDDRVLTPRVWTSRQARWAAELAASSPRRPLLELCSGVGHIGLLAAHLSGRSLVAVDANAAACSWSARNAQRAGVDIDVRQADLGDALGPDELFDVVIADPPWVEHARVSAFPEDPLTAIDGGIDGLDVARLCLDVASAHLTARGSVLLQLGSLEQLDALRDEIARHGLAAVDHREEPGRGIVVLLARSGA